MAIAQTIWERSRDYVVFGVLLLVALGLFVGRNGPVLRAARALSLCATAPVEGLFARRPVVASDVQGLAEVLTDGRTGLLVPADDPTALAGAVARLLDDPGLRSTLAAQGLADARARFSTARYAQAMRRELEAATATVRGGHRPRFTRRADRSTRRFG